jgi:hypothetical protein
VADPGCLSLIPDPDFYPSRILDPKTATKKTGDKKFVVITFYVATNFTKLQIILVEVLKKKIWANFQRIIELFTQKIVTKLSKIWIWDPGSGKNLFRIPDPGVKKAPDPGSGSATLQKNELLTLMTMKGSFSLRNWSW